MVTTPEIHTHDSTRLVSTPTETRQAVPQGVFYVLAVSLVLVVAAFTAIYVW